MDNQALEDHVENSKAKASEGISFTIFYNKLILNLMVFGTGIFFKCQYIM